MVPTLLVVEDNVDNMILLKDMLDKRYHIVEATDGEQALTVASAIKCSLVLLDIALPRMSGEEVLVHLRNMSHYQTAPIIAVTAHAMDSDRERFMKLGFDEYVAKPINELELCSKIEALIPLSRHAV